jgi:hypothetical protein
MFMVVGLWNMVTSLRYCYLFSFSWIQVSPWGGRQGSCQ